MTRNEIDDIIAHDAYSGYLFFFDKFCAWVAPEGWNVFSQQEVDSLYVHIPFCPHKCFYCDFNSYVVEEESLVDRYLRALHVELTATAEQSSNHPLRTIFIGGGTPSMLSPQQLERLLTSLQSAFPNRSEHLEFTIEANPGTVDQEKLAVMRAFDINRISFGAQTFDEGLLQQIGRIHSADDVEKSLELARAAGFSNLSIDLMFGLPGQTMAMLVSSVARALSFALPHISLYGLKIEENTVFHHLYMRNQLALPEEELELEMYRYIISQLTEAGYGQYEVSNFALPGAESRHNLGYWKNRAYFGVGAGAHGYVDGIRHVNVKGVQAYIDACASGLPRLEQSPVSRAEAMEDFMMVGLRMLDGVTEDAFKTQFGVGWGEPFGQVLCELLEHQLLQQTATGYRLSERGLYLGNEVFGRFLGEANL